jgi:hypothetical protein
LATLQLDAASPSRIVIAAGAKGGASACETNAVK